VTRLEVAEEPQVGKLYHEGWPTPLAAKQPQTTGPARPQAVAALQQLVLLAPQVADHTSFRISV
jgi:hypothetical protein